MLQNTEKQSLQYCQRHRFIYSSSAVFITALIHTKGFIQDNMVLTFSVPIKKKKKNKVPQQEMWSFFEQFVVFHLVLLQKFCTMKQKHTK